MTPPRFETWFMEGRLVPDVHYVALAEDYSDLEAKLAEFGFAPFSPGFRGGAHRPPARHSLR